MIRNILLPIDYEVPFDLEKDPEYNSYIIDIGFKVKKYFCHYNYDFNDIIKVEQENFKKSIEFIQLNNDIDKKNYINEIEKLKKENHESEIKTKTKFTAEINALQEELFKMQSVYREQSYLQITNTEKEILKLKVERDELNHKLNDFMTKHVQQILDNNALHNSREQSYLQIINTEKEQNKKLTETISESLSKKYCPQQIGVIGEEMIEQWTRELFIEAEIINQSQQTAKGDLHIKLNGRTLMFEIKNKNIISRNDIEKFIRDVSGLSDTIHGALFISLITPAIPNKGDFSIDYVNKIPVVYLHVADKQTLRVAIKSLLFLNNKTDTTSIVMCINNIYNRINSISSNHTTIERSLNDLRTAFENNKREIKTSIHELDTLFEDDPSLKFELSVNRLEFNKDEIERIIETNKKIKKPKISDFTDALSCTPKYLQDRGGILNIKKIIGVNTPNTFILPNV